MMFENVTQDTILSEMLEDAAELSDVDLAEGSFVYNALSVAAMALEDAYSDADAVMANAMADTCDREHLIRFAKAKGLEPREATKAQYALECNVELPVGFQLTDGEFDYTVLTEGTTPTAQIETAGSAGNDRTVGLQLSAVDYIDGFETCEITARTGRGEDEEDTEDFRARYFEALDVRGMFGNKAFYKELAMSVDGVEQVGMIYRGGVLYVGVLGPGNAFVSESVNTAVSDLLTENAPFGHTVSVNDLVSMSDSAALNLNVSGITPSSENTEANQDLISTIIQDYIYKMRDNFDTTRYLYGSRLHSYVLAKLEEAGSGITSLTIKKGSTAIVSLEYPGMIIPSIESITFES